MEQRRVILAGAIALVAAIVVLGVVMAVGGLLPGLFGNKSENTTISNLPIISSSITPAPTFTDLSGTPNPSQTPNNSNQNNIVVAPNSKVYVGDGFSLSYPNTWGLLTCSNSKNFELDPTSSTDSLNVSCNRALKPVTILVHTGSFSCPGNSVTLGNNSAVKSTKKWSDGEIDYRWCVSVGGKTLDISHRFSPNGGRATSTTDYSSQVEDLIKTISSSQNSPS